jgi:hydrogenase/urease accessory protein HupE
VIAVIVAIAAQTFIVTELGLRLGTRLSRRAREDAVRVAGFALTALGVTLLVEKLLA